MLLELYLTLKGQEKTYFFGRQRCDCHGVIQPAQLPLGSFIVLSGCQANLEKPTFSKKICLLPIWPIVFVMSESSRGVADFIILVPLI